MTTKQIERVGVIGAGMMGAQIIELLSRVGKCFVLMYDLNDELVDKGFEVIRLTLKRFFLDKGKLTQEEMEEIVGRVSGTTSIAEVAKKSDFVIEAVIENLDVKKDIFKQVDENAPPEAIFASNTSGLSITEMANATNRPGNVVGMHFFNPVGVMVLVEVVRGSLTSDETAEMTCLLARKGAFASFDKAYDQGWVHGRSWQERYLRFLERGSIEVVTGGCSRMKEVSRGFQGTGKARGPGK